MLCIDQVERATSGVGRALIWDLLRRRAISGRGWERVSLLLRAELSLPWADALFQSQPGSSPPPLSDLQAAELGPLDDDELIRFACEQRVPWPASDILRLGHAVGHHPFLAGLLFSASREWEWSVEEALTAGGIDRGPLKPLLEPIAIAFGKDETLLRLAREAVVPRGESAVPTDGLPLEPGAPGSESWQRHLRLYSFGLIRRQGAGFVGACPLMQAWLDRR